MREVMPWYAAKPAPSTKIPTAASRDQKYRAIPKPNGCSGSGGRWLRLTAVSRNAWFRVSPTEGGASASMADDPETRPATGFAPAISRPAAPATSTVPADSSSVVTIRPRDQARQSILRPKESLGSARRPAARVVPRLELGRVSVLQLFEKALALGDDAGPPGHGRRPLEQDEAAPPCLAQRLVGEAVELTGIHVLDGLHPLDDPFGRSLRLPSEPGAQHPKACVEGDR